MKNKKTVILCLFSLLFTVLVGCKDDNDDSGSYDPNQPVVFTTFEPIEGSVRNKFFINGSNFGSDPTKIKVTIGGVPAVVINADNKIVYCQVPKIPQDGSTQVVEVKASLLDDTGREVFTQIFEEKFSYIPKMVVGTLVGKIDPANDKANMVDGLFEDAEFDSPYSMVFDKGDDGVKRLYLVEVAKALREINLTERSVSTLVTNGQSGMTKMQTLLLDITKDTIFLADDNGQNNLTKPVLRYTTRKEGFKRVYPYIYDRTGYSVTQHPDGNIFYNTYWDARVLKVRGKYDEKTQQWVSKELFSFGAKSGHTYLFMHPDGLYTYMLGAAYRSIYRATYNFADRELEKPALFVGQVGTEGYVDAPGTQARFGDPMRQGVFVKNKKYVAEGKKDVYDFYFCDTKNNCIRMVTPETGVSTVAGRGTQTGTTAGNAAGYVDGDPRLEARFNTPTAIAYDEEDEVIYVADQGNRRIRYIRTE